MKSLQLGLKNGASVQKVVAAFVTPHGFGHAARVCSVLQVLEKSDQDYHFLIFSIVPEWFFRASLSQSFSYHILLTDIGLVQKDPLQEDIPATLEKLDSFLPFQLEQYQSTITILEKAGCDLILADISPLGIFLGKKLGIPSLLVENFTWDWIYKGYEERYPAFKDYLDYLKNIYAETDFRIVAEPYCELNRADLVAKPISRLPKSSSDDTREKLGVAIDAKVVIVSMGGVESDYTQSKQLKKYQEYTFIIPGGSDQLEKENNIIRLPFRSDFYHPDLIHASNVVISKIGYSTLAETFNSGKPYGYIPRESFRESEVLKNYIKVSMLSIEIEESEYRSGDWVEKLNLLFSLQQKDTPGKTGADQVADFIMQMM